MAFATDRIGMYAYALLIALLPASAQEAPHVVALEASGAQPQSLTVSGGRLYFSADEGLLGRELWTLDGENDVRMVLDINFGAPDANPEFLTPADGGLAFLAISDRVEIPQVRQIWFTRGDHESTRPISEYTQDPAIQALCGAGPYLYMVRDTAEPSLSLWRIYLRDGGAQPERVEMPVWRPKEYAHHGLFGDGHTLFIAGEDPVNKGRGQIYHLPNPDTFPKPLLDDEGRSIEATNLYRVSWYPWGNTFYFATERSLYAFSRGSDHARKLLGPKRSTGIVTQVAPGSPLTYFNGVTKDYGAELWASDGTSRGTRLVKDILSGQAAASPYSFARIGKLAVFVAQHPDYGTELWVSDGTEQGTKLLADLLPGPRGAEPYSVHGVGDERVIFSCYNAAVGEELWVTDGTTGGTRLLKDIRPGPRGSSPYNMRTFGKYAYFAATTDEEGEQLWRSDGTPEGTTMVAARNPAFRTIGSSTPRELTTFQDRVYFSAFQPGLGRELWASDGTYTGTRCVSDLAPGRESGNPHSLTVRDDGLYFQATVANALAWYRLTSKSTTVEPCSPPIPEPANKPIPIGGTKTAIFSGWTLDTGTEPWIQHEDGTQEILVDLLPGPASSNPREFCPHDGKVYFHIDTVFAASDCVVTDGTPEGTHTEFLSRPRHFISTPQGLLTMTEREPGNMVLLDNIGRSKPYELSTMVRPEELAVNSRFIFFVCETPANGTELWCAPLPPLKPEFAASQLVRDICP